MKPSDASPLLDSLTEREAEILRLIADGYSNSEIAEKLFLTLGTVKWYNTQIFDKLGVKSRSQAVARAREWNLLANGEAPASQPAPPATTANQPHLPTFPIPFVGREAELRQILNLLDNSDCSLLTLVGPGGMGKTRLAVESAKRLSPRFADGVVFVSLAPLSSPDDIAATIAATVNISITEGQDKHLQLLDYFRTGNRLLVMDNFDTLLNGAGLVSDLLSAAPGLKVLVTSRERLNLQEEIVFRVEGLELPNTSTSALDNSAVRLFLGRARSANPQFEPNDNDLNHIVRICRMVEGMPLAILLAAAWIEMLTPEEIAQEIARSLDFLQTDMRNIPARHRSIRGVFESAWKLLSPDEQTAFARLSVFRGGFTREAAEYVTGAGLRTMMGLMNKSLLHRDADGRYEIHQLLRQYAEERLHQQDAAGATYQAHSRYYLDLLSQYEDSLKTNTTSQALEQLEGDMENIRAAWNCAVEKRQFEMIDKTLNSLYLFCNRAGRLEDGLKCFDQAIQAAEQINNDIDPRTSLRLRAYRGRARMWMGISHFDGAASDLFYARAGAHQLGDFAWERDLLVSLGQLYRKTERHNDAIRHLTQVLDYARANNDQRGMADILYHLGTVVWDEGDNVQARAYHEEAAVICQRLQLKDIVGVQAFHGLGESLLLSGHPTTAIDNFRASLELARQIGDVAYESENLQMMGWTSIGGLGTGDYAAALEYFSRSLAISQDAHLDWHTMCTLMGLGLVQGAMGDYQQGLVNIHQGHRMAESVGLARFRSLALDALGQHYQDLNLLAQAEAAHAQGVHLMRHTESTFWLSRLQANCAIDRMRQGDLSVEYDLREALDIALQRNQEFHATRCLEGLAELGVRRKHPETTLRYADELLALAEPRQMREMIAQGYRWRGQAWLLAEDAARAEHDLKRALEIGEAIGRVRLLWDIHIALAACYRMLGDEPSTAQHDTAARDIQHRIEANLTDEALRGGSFVAPR